MLENILNLFLYNFNDLFFDREWIIFRSSCMKYLRNADIGCLKSFEESTFMPVTSLEYG